MDNNGTIQPSPPDNSLPPGQEIILNLNHGPVPVTPPPGAVPAMPPASPISTPSGQPAPMPSPNPYAQAQPMPIGPQMQQPQPQFQQPYRPIVPGGGGQAGYGNVPQRPGSPWLTGPVQQPTYPIGATPQGGPVGMAGQQVVSGKDTGGNKKLLFIITTAVVVLLLIGGGAYAAVVLSGNKKPVKKASGTAALNCSAPSTGSDAAVTTQNAETAYVRVATALKEKNQSCVNSLSSSYFDQLQAQTFPGSNGKWITKSQDNQPPLSTRLADLPTTYAVSKFTSSAYTRAAATTTTTDSSSTQSPSSTSAPLRGLTISYVVTDAHTDAQAYLEISFISANGKLAIDYLKLVPVPSTSNTSAANQNPAASDAGAVAANQELAQEDIISIDAYLTAYRGGLNSYPSTISAAIFTSAGVGVDTTAFTPPAGTSFVYTATPSGCTTEAKNCTAFTLTAVDTVTNSTIYSMTGSMNS